MSTSEIIALISVCIAFVGLVSTICALIYTVKNSKRVDAKDLAEKIKESATVNLKLDTITNTVTDIKYDISATKKDVANLSIKVAEIEQSAKSAHRRLDSVEERLNP